MSESSDAMSQVADLLGSDPEGVDQPEATRQPRRQRCCHRCGNRVASLQLPTAIMHFMLVESVALYSLYFASSSVATQVINDAVDNVVEGCIDKFITQIPNDPFEFTCPVHMRVSSSGDANAGLNGIYRAFRGGSEDTLPFYRNGHQYELRFNKSDSSWLLLAPIEQTLVNSSITWSNCYKACSNAGLRMPCITDAQRNAVLLAAMKGSAWIGYSDKDDEGAWKWNPGCQSSYSHWAPGQPDNSNGNEHYATLAGGAWNDKWNDVPADFVSYSHVGYYVAGEVQCFCERWPTTIAREMDYKWSAAPSDPAPRANRCPNDVSWDKNIAVTQHHSEKDALLSSYSAHLREKCRPAIFLGSSALLWRVTDLHEQCGNIMLDELCVADGGTFATAECYAFFMNSTGRWDLEKFNQFCQQLPLLKHTGFFLVANYVLLLFCGSLTTMFFFKWIRCGGLRFRMWSFGNGEYLALTWNLEQEFVYRFVVFCVFVGAITVLCVLSMVEEARAAVMGSYIQVVVVFISMLKLVFVTPPSFDYNDALFRAHTFRRSLRLFVQSNDVFGGRLADALWVKKSEQFLPDQSVDEAERVCPRKERDL